MGGRRKEGGGGVATQGYPPAVLVQQTQPLQPALLVVFYFLQSAKPFLEELQCRVERLQLPYPYLRKKKINSVRSVLPHNVHPISNLNLARHFLANCVISDKPGEDLSPLFYINDLL
jgi:hypothetical protein